MALRVRVAGVDGARSETAAVWFAVALGLVALATQQPAVPRAGVLRGMFVGLAGAAVLCLPAAARHLALGGYVAPTGFGRWAVFVVVVAVAEEALLRGSLFRLIESRSGGLAAIAVTSVAFGLLHAPVYGWGVVPLDIAVGVWLGTLRAVTGTVAAPAVAHVAADLAGWWLR